jgi:hypothetical protein
VTDGAAHPGPLEWAGWGLLAVLTLVIMLLAFLRPTNPDAIVNEIRLAAGFDRYQAAMDEGDRLFGRATAEFRLSRAGEEDLSIEYSMLADAAARFRLARDEAEGFGEGQRAQIRLGETYYVWAKALLDEGTGPWYRGNDEETLERGRALIDQALLLPNLTGEQRVRLEDLRTRIDRALTPWPIL